MILNQVLLAYTTLDWNQIKKKINSESAGVVMEPVVVKERGLNSERNQPRISDL